MLCTVTLLCTAGLAGSPANAAVSTVTLKNGDVEFYGSAAFGTRVRWVTHINGEAIDLDDVPGVSRSYAYCVQPAKECPDAGTYPVTVVDDDDTGRLAKMRKLIYYLPGAYGYKSKTRSRWFSEGMDGASAYAIGHVALSFLYDNCSEETDAWKGASSAVKSKVKHMISDLGNLKDPPDDFEVFWVKLSGMQDTFGAIYATEYGKAAVKKQSSNTGISSGNSCYSLSGAEYTVYEDAACRTPAKCRDGSEAVIKLKSDGSSEEITLEAGDYYVRETRAPKGYALSTEAHSLEVIKDKTSTFTAHDVPKSKPLGIVVQKKDAETALAKPQAAAGLKGAEFTISYYDIIPSGEKTSDGFRKDIAGAEPAKINGKPAVWVLQTDEEGKIDFSQPDKYLIKEKSADLYKDSKGRPVIPIGIISIQETKAPEGYALNSNLYVRYVPDKAKSFMLHFLITRSRHIFMDANIQHLPLCFCAVMPVVGTTILKSIGSFAAFSGTKAASVSFVELIARERTLRSGLFSNPAFIFSNNSGVIVFIITSLLYSIILRRSALQSVYQIHTLFSQYC